MLSASLSTGSGSDAVLGGTFGDDHVRATQSANPSPTPRRAGAAPAFLRGVERSGAGDDARRTGICVGRSDRRRDTCSDKVPVPVTGAGTGAGTGSRALRSARRLTAPTCGSAGAARSPRCTRRTPRALVAHGVGVVAAWPWKVSPQRQHLDVGRHARILASYAAGSSRSRRSLASHSAMICSNWRRPKRRRKADGGHHSLPRCSRPLQSTM